MGVNHIRLATVPAGVDHDPNNYAQDDGSHV